MTPGLSFILFIPNNMQLTSISRFYSTGTAIQLHPSFHWNCNSSSFIILEACFHITIIVILGYLPWRPIASSAEHGFRLLRDTYWRESPWNLTSTFDSWSHANPLHRPSGIVKILFRPLFRLFERLAAFSGTFELSGLLSWVKSPKVVEVAKSAQFSKLLCQAITLDHWCNKANL